MADPTNGYGVNIQPLLIVTARQEFNRIVDFDYVVLNRENQLDQTLDTILPIIAVEHHRVEPRKSTL